ncbi:PAS domain S-box protein [Thiorhodospira sibirica]|uniref:PAS domain S-box protein n=1 Tax=Thiorhodospira sibirica TaxID=154347 RepID=UPI0002DA6CBE|nr:PAS domain S-box protein [Thiorhodospira sibirica]
MTLLIWLPALGLGAVLVTLLLRQLNPGTATPQDRRRPRLISFTLVGLFLALALTLAMHGLHQIEQEVRGHLGETLQSINASVEQAMQIWHDNHLHELERITPMSTADGHVLALPGLQQELGQFTRIGRIGKTGETYAFDRDGTVLTPSRFAPVYAPDGSLTRMAASALLGKSGVDTMGYLDYRGVPVIGAWTWSESLGLGLATEMDLAEALEPYRALRDPVLGALLGVILLALGLTAALLSFGRRARVRLDQLVATRTRELRKYVQAVEQNPLCIVVTDRDGRIEHVNPTFSQVTGYSAAEALGENPRLLKSDNTPPETYQDLWATILAGHTWHGELCNRRKNGETYWTSLSIAPVSDEAGQISHFVGMAQDLTATKHAESALRAAETARNLALDAAGLGLWSGDLRTNTWHWDARFALLLGLPEDQPASVQAGLARLHPEDRPAVEAAFAAALRGECALNIEYRVRWPDGSEHYIATRGNTVLDAQGLPLRIDGAAYDRTELRRAEAEIASAREHNALILDSAGEGIIGLDMHGGVTFCNRAAAELLGYRAAELISRPLHQTIHSRRADGSLFHQADCPMNRTLVDGQRREVNEDILWRQDGSALLVEYVVVPVHKHGKRIGAVLVFKDIAERVSVQRTLHAVRAQLQEILDSSPLSAAITVAGVIRFTNRSFYETFARAIGDSVRTI